MNIFSSSSNSLDSSDVLIEAVKTLTDQECYGVVKFLSNQGLDLNKQEESTLFSALHYAVEKCLPNTVGMLISCGANVNILAANQVSPLSLAYSINEENMVKPTIINLLLQSGGIAENNSIAEPKETQKNKIEDHPIKVENETLRSKTVYTFTPAILPTRKDTSPVNLEGIQSPTTEDIFKFAGWRSPSHQQERDLYSYSPFPTYGSKGMEIDDDKLRKMEKIDQEFVSAAYEEFKSSLQDLATADQTNTIINQQKSTLKQSSTAHTSEDQDDDETDSIVEIPNSYDEIYKISLKNRQKNKVKKRSRDIDDWEKEINKDDNNEIISKKDHKDKKGENFDPSLYFTNIEGTADCSVDGTLNYARKIGWVENQSDQESLKESFYNETNVDSSLQSEGISNLDTHLSNNSNVTSSPLRKSNEGKKMSRSYDKNNSSNNNLRRSNNQKSNLKDFDYSKVNSGAMGAISTSYEEKVKKPRSGSKGRNGISMGFDDMGAGNSRNKNSKSKEFSNPFLPGGGRKSKK